MESELCRLIDALPGFVWMALPDGQVEFLSHQWREYTGLEADESYGRRWQAAIHPEDLPRLLEGWQSVHSARAPADAEARLRGADGSYRWFLFRAQPSADASGQVCCGLSIDIDERKRAEQAVRASERQFRLIVDGLPLLLSTATADGELHQANRHYLEYFGGTLEELKAREAPHSLHPDDRGRVLPLRQEAMAAGRPYEIECRRRRADGIYRWFYLRAFPLRDAEGHIALWYRLQTDIEEQKRAEVLLAAEKQLLEMVAGDYPLSDMLETLCRHVEAVAGGSFCSIVLLDPGGVKLQEGIAPSLPAEFNDAVRGWPLNRLGGPCQVAARDNIQVIMSDVASDTRWRTSWRALAQKHGLRSCWSTPIVSRAGNVLGTFALYQRETANPDKLQLELIEQFTHIASIAIERAQRDADLRESEVRRAEAERDLQRTIDTIPTLVATYRPDGSRIFVNQPWLDYTGLSRDSAMDAERASIAHPDDAERVTKEWKKCLTEGVPFKSEMRLRRVDGEYRWHSVHRVVAHDESGASVKWYSVAVDIDERKRAEEALRQNEAQLADAKQELQITIDTIPTLIASYSPNGERDFVSKNWQEYTGISQDEARGKNSTNTFHPERRVVGEDMWRACLASGEPYEANERLRRADGEYRWHWIRRVPLRDESGKIIKWYGVGHDVEHQKQAEAALLSSETRLAEAERELRVTLDSIPTITWRAGANGYVEQLNKRWFEYTGTTPEQVRGWRWKLCVHPDDLDRLVEVGSQYVASGTPIDAEARLRRHDGEYRWFLFRPSPARDETGKVVAWYGTITDIEDRKGAEDKAVEAEREVQHMLDSIPAMIVRGGTNGYIQYFSKQWFDYTGTTLETTRGFRWWELLHPDDKDRLVEFGARFVATAKPSDCEARLRRFDGTYRWFLFRPAPMRDEAGNFIGWYGTVTDIEDRKRAEEKVIEAERETQRTIDNIPVRVGIYDADGTRISANKRVIELSGDWRLVYHPDDADLVESRWRECVASGESFECEYRWRMADGTYRWQRSRRVPLHDESGKVIRWYGIGYDIEDQRRAEQALAASERNLKLIVDSIPALAWAARLDGSAEFCNQNYTEYTGLSLEQLQNWGFSKAVHPDDVDELGRTYRAILASGRTGESEARLRRHDGQYRWFMFRATPLRDETGQPVKWYGIGYDIEDRKRAEQALAANERNLQLTFDTMPAIAWAASTDGSAEFFNQNYLDYVGLPLDQVLGWGWTAVVHPDDLDGLARTWQTILAAGTPGEAEARLRRHDGEYRWFLFRASPLLDENGKIARWYGVNTDIEDRKRIEEELRRNETLLSEGQRLSSTGTFSWLVDTNKIAFSQELYRIFEFEPNSFLTFGRLRERTHPEDRALMDEKVRAVRAGRDTPEYEIRLQMLDGRVKYLRIIGRLLRRQDGRLECLGAIQDVTQGRSAEAALDKVRSELARVTRVMSLGTLTASIAHEVNQPLAGIITNASTCLRMLAADPPNIDGARETARRTIRDGNRAADVITRLRALFSKTPPAAHTVDLNEATREVLALVFGDLLRNRVILRVELDDTPLLVTGDRTQLQQVILNLIRNASDALSDVTERPRQLVVKAEKQEDGACVIVTDLGVGLQPRETERVFDAFYTTKNDGMGIGLSVSRSIVESHGGRLWAEANEGPGATFSFFIPRATSAGDDGADGAIWRRQTRGAHDETRNA